MIDVSAVQAYHSEQDLRELVEVARANAFIAVHSLPCWTPLVAELLRDRPDIVVGAPVGFPSGAHRPETKRFEARTLVEDGVGEMDVMMNIGKLKSGDDTYVLDDIAGVREEARDVPIKVIIETPHLSRDEVIRATRIVVRSGAAFVKTGSGWTGESVDLDTLRVIVDEAEGAVQVKAAGGIRTLSTLEAMYDLGVRRFGINTASALSILDECGTGSS
jgi:deoxyribose-phosphate aldolase